MPCCGGKNGGKPISRLQYLVGRTVFVGLRVTLTVGLHGVALIVPRFREIARFWDLLAADWAAQIESRDGITVIGEALEDDACPMPVASHVTATGGDVTFGAGWADDDALLDDVEAGVADAVSSTGAAA